MSVCFDALCSVVPTSQWPFKSMTVVAPEPPYSIPEETISAAPPEIRLIYTSASKQRHSYGMTYPLLRRSTKTELGRRLQTSNLPRM